MIHKLMQGNEIDFTTYLL